MSYRKNSKNSVWHHAAISRANRESLNNHRGAIIWFTGFSGSGKSTLAHAVEEALYQSGCHTFVLDGDNIRHGLCSDLEFSQKDRQENIRRVGEVAKLFMDAGVIVLTALISPYKNDRDQVRLSVNPSDFIEIFCDAPLEICESRDTKGLYKKARSGELINFTGISAPYEKPINPELVINTSKLPVNESVDEVLSILNKYGIYPKS